MQTLLLALVIFFPIAWYWLNRRPRWLRITLGVCCFGIGILRVFGGRIGQTFNDNAE